jgi:hypothetical protein
MPPCPPPSSEDPSLPPRHRLSVEKLRKEALESELWALEDELEHLSSDSQPPVFPHDPSETDLLEPHAVEGEYPDTAYFNAAIESQQPDESDPEPSYPAMEDTEQPWEPYPTEYPHDDQETPPKTYPEYPAETFPPQPWEAPQTADPHELTESPTRRAIHDDLGELAEIGEWDDQQNPPTLFHAPPEPYGADTPHGESNSATTLEENNTQALIPPHTTTNRRKITFSRKEIVATSTLALALIMIASLFILHALRGLPRMKDPYQKPDLPTAGSHFTITSVNSYWRAPVTTGPNVDTVQRGTELIPVLEITASGNHAALRVQFRNSEGAAIGDLITHPVNGETNLVIPSTAGLEDINVHNAYRTGLIAPWTAEILEAPVGTTAGSAFHHVITVPISPNRR